MEKIYITDPGHPLYPALGQLYASGFPVFEQRTEAQQLQAFSSPEYRMAAYLDNSIFIGFVAYWEFPAYRYVEHFAVDRTFRGKGYGSRIMKHFIEETQKSVVLEIDPPADEPTRARLRFYQRCGFLPNPYAHVHPPYRKEYDGHPLLVLSAPGELSENAYRQFENDLHTRVMNDAPRQDPSGEKRPG